MPSTLDAVQVLFLFVVPGYLVDQFIRRVSVRSSRGSSEAVLTYVIWSGICFMVNAPILMWLKSNQTPWVELLRLIATMLAVPLAVGYAVSQLLKAGDKWEWPKKVSPFIVHPVPRAWDWKFSQRECLWVRVTLADGTKIGGWYGGKSFVSSSPAQDDIYLEVQWRLGDDLSFKEPVPRSAGVLIRGERIQSIEFLRD